MLRRRCRHPQRLKRRQRQAAQRRHRRRRRQPGDPCFILDDSVGWSPWV